MATVLRWRALPIVDDYPRSLLCAAAVVTACVAVHVAFGGAGYALLAAVVLGVSLGRYFLPTSYELDESGARVRFLFSARSTPWDRVRRFDVHREGVYLSPFERPSRLDSFRGTFLRFSGNADEVVRFVERKVEPSR
jgi:hypothetical protein